MNATRIEFGINRTSLVISCALGITIGCVTPILPGVQMAWVPWIALVGVGGVLGTCVGIIAGIMRVYVGHYGLSTWMKASICVFVTVASLGLAYPIFLSPGDWQGWRQWLIPGMAFSPVMAAMNGWFHMHSAGPCANHDSGHPDPSHGAT